MKHSFNFFKFCRNISEFYYKMCFLLFRALDKGKDQHPFNNMDRQDYPLKHSQGCQSGISLHPDFFRVLIPNCPKTWKQLLLFPIVILPNSVNVILASFQITPRDIVLNFFQMTFPPLSFDILLSSSGLQTMDYFKSSQ